MRAADVVVQLLVEHQVAYIFGVPGDTSMTFHHALEKYSDKIKYVACRDERHAVYMADTYARVSGKPGVVDVPSGGGLLYAVPGLSEATSSSIPVICISSDISMSSEGTGALTELKQEEVTRAVTKWNTTIKQSAQIPRVIHKAFRIAVGGRPGAVHISIPENIHEEKLPIKQLDCFGVDAKQYCYRNAPLQEDVEKISTMIFQSKRPVILAGGGVHLSEAYDDLEKLAKSFNIPVATTINGKGSINETLDQAVGVIGVNGGSEETNHIIKQSDFVLVLGSKLNNVTTVAKTLFKASPKIVQVDISEEILDLNVKTNLSIMCDIKSFLKELNASMEKQASASFNLFDWIKEYQTSKKQKWKRIQTEAEAETVKVNPGKVVYKLNELTNKNTIFVIDAGTQTPYMAANFILKQPGRKMVFDRGHGNLGYALSAAIGAKLAKQEAKVISMFGDGSFAMSVGELETVGRLGLPIVFIHFQNDSYGWIKKLHQLYYDARYIGVDFKTIDASKIAEGFGIKSYKIKRNDEIEKGLRWALAQGAPVFLDIEIEPITQIVPPVTNWREDYLKDPAERKALTY